MTQRTVAHPLHARNWGSIPSTETVTLELTDVLVIRKRDIGKSWDTVYTN